MDRKASHFKAYKSTATAWHHESFWNDKENHFYQLFIWIYTPSLHKIQMKGLAEEVLSFIQIIQIVKYWEVKNHFFKPIMGRQLMNWKGQSDGTFDDIHIGEISSRYST